MFLKEEESAVSSWKKSMNVQLDLLRKYWLFLKSDSKYITLQSTSSAIIIKPEVELSAAGPDEIKCHVANTGSFSAFVGDLVHGWDWSSDRGSLGLVRIGFGARTLSWLAGRDDDDTGGGVLRRGTPKDKHMDQNKIS